MPATVATLFETVPRQWGLRGDPHLWAELRGKFATTPLPTDDAALQALLAEAFADATGTTLEATEIKFVQRLAHGGMSSGCVFPPWWRGTGVPFLLARANALRDG